jgi:N-acetylglucosaminyl-diphospho-decaprenol L-rhamnosyltransferase
VDLAIVVVTHNSEAVIGRCLASLGALIDRVVVADNASSDRTVALARAAGAEALVNEENLGFARAANRAAAMVRAPWLCFLNPDCEAPPDLFDRAQGALDGFPWRCAVPTLIDADGRLVDGRQPGYTRLKLCADVLETAYGVTAVSRWMRRRPGHDDRRWGWPHGACLFIGRELFWAVGGFDTRLFLYMEDVQLGRQIAARGGEIVQLDGWARHAGGRGAAVPESRRRLLLMQGRIRYARLVHGALFSAFLAAAAWPGMALRRALRAAA